MRTAASEHLSHAQVMSRLSATFSALIKEQIEVVRRYLDSEHVDLESSEMGPIVDLAVRLVERSAEWLELTEVANLARELRETLSQLDQLRPTQRQEMVAHCNVALEAESKLAEQLRTDGFGALLAHAGTVGDAIDSLRNGMTRAKAQAMAASRGVIDETTPEVGPHENLLALTFEIKSALVHQNERIASMNDTLDSTLRSLQSALSDWELHIKGIERKRMSGQSRASDPPDPRTLTVHTQLQEAASGLRSLSHEMNHLLGLQYSLERRARDLDEHLLWEFLDPLDRFVDDMYQAVSRRGDAGRAPILTVHTGGVGFEPEIGSILLPLIVRLLETAMPSDSDTGPIEIRVNAAREGLEARLAIEGFLTFDPKGVTQLESALEGLGGFVHIQGGASDITSLRIQFPMARALRSFLIVEAGGQRIALPWSAVERIHATEDELQWSGSTVRGPIHPLGALFGRGYLGEAGALTAESDTSSESGIDGEGKKERGRPLAILRCGGGAVVVGFDRIVWRENARLTQLPPRLCPVDEVLGGIVSPDSNVILVLNPGALVRRLKSDEGGAEGTAE